ncbi:MAG: RND family transporter [Deltaproteobacteria bacterium]|nr:RND family transporter [Deltaproteobacteria bacterium]
MVARVLELVIRHPKLVVCICIAFTLGLGSGITRIQMDPSIKNLLPEELPEWQNLQKFEKMFTGSEIVLVAVTVDDLFDGETLARLHRLQEGLEQIPDAYRVLSVFTMKHLESSPGSFKPVPLLDPESPPQTPEDRKEARKRLSDELYVGNIISRDLKSVAFVVLPIDRFQDTRMAEDVMRVTRDVMGDSAVSTGLPVTRVSVLNGMQRDMRTFLPIGIVLMVILLVFSFNTWLGTVLPLVVVVMSVAATFGLMGYMDEKIMMVTVIMPVMLIAVANDYAIHLVAHYLGRRGREPSGERRAQIFQVSSSLGPPVLAAGLTTVAGFLTLTTHVIPAARFAGVMAAFGVVLAFILSLTFVPAMMVLLRPPSNVAREFASGLTDRLLVQASSLLRDHGGRVTAILAVLGVVAMTGIPDVVVDTDPVHYFAEGTPIRKANDFVNRVFGGSAQMNVVVEGDIKDPALLGRVRELQEFLEREPMVSRTQSIADPIMRMNRAFHDDDPAWEVVPDRRDAVAQFLLLYSFQSDLTDFDHMVDFPYTHGQVAARVNSTSANALKTLVEDTERHIEEHLSSSEFTMVTGFVTVLGTLVELIVHGQLISIAMSLGLIFLIGCFFFRSIVAGLYVVLPLTFALGIIFGLMGHFEIELNIATVMMASVVIGVGVDYIIHFLWHYRENLSVTGDRWGAVERTLSTSGRGIVVNALSVVVGFCVLLLSSFLPVMFLGFMLTVSIVTCVVVALTVVPVLSARLCPAFLRRPAGAEADVPVPPGLDREPGRVSRGITRLLQLGIAAGVATLLYLAGAALVRWNDSLLAGLTFWSELWRLVVENPSIVAAIYCLLCVNAAGVAEFKFRRSFTQAFLYAVALTPPVMIAAWARKPLGATPEPGPHAR